MWVSFIFKLKLVPQNLYKMVKLPHVKFPRRTDLSCILLFSCNDFGQPEYKYTSFIAWFSGWNKLVRLD